MNLFVRIKHFTLIIALAAIALLSSCGSKKDLVYFQNSGQAFSDNTKDNTLYDLRIRPKDNLYITVSSTNPAAVEPYNVFSTNNINYTTQGLEYRGYLVDEEGNIKFPGLGVIHLGGMTKTDAEAYIQKEITKTVEDCSVNIRFINYKISILGEVNRPGIYTISNERVSIVEAIAMAGDLTIYGQRHDIQIYRVENGEKKTFLIDITDPNIFFSPYYYLEQNDIIYVSPNSTRVRSSTNIMPVLSVVITSASFILTTLAFIKN
jgi:polysaccharide export outer membrane protein